MDVTTARSAGGYVLHVGNMIEGHLSIGDHVTATLAGVRPRTEKNHTATHLANWALREVLGEGVQQKGSLVDPEKLRFDFSHGKAVADEELGRVESLVAQCVEKKMPVYAQEAPQEQALKINGLRAVFGEKYPPMVRVVSVGVPVGDLLKDPANSKWRRYSVEFCGGTHLKNTGDVGAFVISAEESVSKGIRRIVALTGEAAQAARAAGERIAGLIRQIESAEGEQITPLIEAFAQDKVRLAPLLWRRRVAAAVAALQSKQKAWEKSRQQSQGGGGADVVAAAGELLERATALGSGKLIVGELRGATGAQLLSAADSLKKKAGSYGIMLASAEEGKVSFVAAVSDDLIAKGLKAGDWIRETAKVTGGGGGGRPQMAQAGGKDPSKLGEALETARKFAAARVAG
jgi:alanyl-tRNA synthetase